MSRPTKPERLQNPIRLLRHILRSAGRTSCSQAELAEKVDISVDSIRGIESGRQTLTEKMANRILCETGAAWNAEDKCWRFWKPTGPVYTREHYDTYLDMLKKEETRLREPTEFFAMLRIRLLLKTLPPEEAFKFSFSLNSFLGGERKKFCPDSFAEFFKDACGFIEVRPELDRDHPLFMLRNYPTRLLRQIIWNKQPSKPTRTPVSAEEIEAMSKDLRPIDFDFAGYDHILKHPELLEEEQKQIAALYSRAEYVLKLQRTMEQQLAKKKRVRK
jgi:transcriptional regulator with XRE-family HTH domain